MQAGRTVFSLALAAAALGVRPGPTQAQSNAKKYAVSTDKAMSAARTVLVRQGFEIVRTAGDSAAQVVYYRRRDRGHGNGHGSLQRLVIRRVNRHVVFEEVSTAVRLDIDYELKL
ncbi:MAG: hypothetical protein H0V43_11155 [Gemmatimonadales bacterium]|nr:hypothetical protein [Gemmatimonadales bacterium]